MAAINSTLQKLAGQLNPRNHPLRYQIGLLGLVAMALFPAGLTVIQLSSVVAVVYLMMFAISWDFVSGYTGQVSLGHAFFFALGGYGTAVLNIQHGLTPLLSIPLAVLIAAVGGLMIGIPALRVRGPYLSLITLIAPLILYQMFILFSTNLPIIAPEGLKGTGGFIESPQPLVGPTSEALMNVGSFQNQVIADYYIAFGLFLIVLSVALVITRTDTGDVFTAIREDEEVLGAIGINPVKFKLFSFVTSGAMAGLAGAAYVHSVAGHPLPENLVTLLISIQVIIMVVIGGMGTITGAVVGAAFFAGVQTVLTLLPVIPIINMTPSALTPVPLFVAAVLVLYYRPEGLVPSLVRVGRRIHGRRRGEEAEMESDANGQTPLERTLDRYREALQDNLR